MKDSLKNFYEYLGYLAMIADRKKQLEDFRWEFIDSLADWGEKG